MPATASSRSSSQASVGSNHDRTRSGRDRSYSTRSKQSSLANISVRSFSDFRAQTSSIPGSSPTTVRRKPLPPNASPQLSCFSPVEDIIDYVDDFTRPGSISSVYSRYTSGQTTASQALADVRRGRESQKSIPEDIYKRSSITFLPPPVSNRSSTTLPRQHVHAQLPVDALAGSADPLQHHQDINGERGGRPALIRIASEISPTSKDPFPASSHAPRLSAPEMPVFQDGLERSISDNSIGSTGSAQTISPTKRKDTPTNKFSTFFGWKSSTKALPDSPTTPFTDGSASPSTSPFFNKLAPPLDRSVSAPRLTPTVTIDVRAANGMQGLYNAAPHTTFIPPTPCSINLTQMDELERELRDVSAELASSIRREMELEDENDRLKDSSLPGLGDITRRTSDYFSDSGSSAAKGSAPDYERRVEELEKSKRKLEQEKGQIKAEWSTKLADELRRRLDLEARLTELENVTGRNNGQDRSGVDTNERVKELETFLEEARRRLNQERESKDNFEDLLAALRAEVAQIRGERDNLAEEIVPQLKARIEGLEHEAAEASTLRYENARMQQELGQQTPNRPRVASIAESGPSHGPSWNGLGGLTRSNSTTFGLKRSQSTLNRSGSIKGRGAEMGGEHKDLEDQRNALHSALKSMIRRHEAQKREHARAVQKLIADRDAATTVSPGRRTFARNVAKLKEEIVVLRKRADDTLTQKWQSEGNLGSVKLALDRAEQETRSLRALLSSRNSVDGLGISLSHDGSESPVAMIKILRRSIQLAESERDAAIREAGTYRQRAHSIADRDLAEDLLDSADRLDELAAQLHESVEQNMDLRERLAAAVEQGEKEQTNSTLKVVEMQSRLKGLEDQLLSAREESETAFAANEDVAKSMANNSTSQVSRLTLSIPGPKFTGHRAGEGIFTARSPKLDMTSTGKAESLNEATKTAVLEKRVADLEMALLEADSEMKSVVQRVEKSRGEIALLQGERETASKGMKDIQTAISEEKQRALKLMI